MRAWAQQFPDLVDIYTVGQSFEGRDIWQMTMGVSPFRRTWLPISGSC